MFKMLGAFALSTLLCFGQPIDVKKVDLLKSKGKIGKTNPLKSDEKDNGGNLYQDVITYKMKFLELMIHPLYRGHFVSLINGQIGTEYTDADLFVWSTQLKSAQLILESRLEKDLTEASIVAVENHIGRLRHEFLVKNKTALDALNVPDFGLVIFADSVWNQKNLTPLRKLKLVAHELLGLLRMELTGQDYITGTITNDMLISVADKDGSLLPRVVLERNPNYAKKVRVSEANSCGADEVQSYIQNWCLSRIPDTKPSPYYKYECVFNASVNYSEKKEWKIGTYYSTVHVPGNFELDWKTKSFSRLWKPRYGWVPYKITKSVTFGTSKYTPAYSYQVPRKYSYQQVNHFCEFSGELSLIGVDPFIPNQPAKLLQKSGPLRELLYSDGYEAIQDCFNYKVRLPNGLRNKAECRETINTQGNFGWELWSVFPYRSKYQPIKIEAYN